MPTWSAIGAQSNVRVLVTGSSGFVGRHLCRFLMLVGAEVLPCPGPDGPGALDVTDGDAVLRRISESRPDGIVHLAGVSSVAWSHENAEKTFLVNGLGTVNVLQAVRTTAPHARVLIIGSGEMYGRIPEGRRAQEEDLLHPLSPYAASKCAAEQVARQYVASYGLQIVCTRPFNHIGPDQSPQFVVPSFARQIAEVKRGRKPAIIDVGDLSPVRDFLHVEDVVRGYWTLLQPPVSPGVYNICAGVGRSIRSVLDELLELSGVSAQIRVTPGRLRTVEIPWLVGDPARLTELGWQPQRSTSEALQEVLREQGV
jgi:GDP-4-dehydro-6-deoxy-D-mannose reductase